MTTLQDAYNVGQSPWIDYIDRQLITTDKIKEVLDSGVVGLTSNPTIWQKAFASTADYDQDIKSGVQAGKTTFQIYDEIAISDIQRAADVLRSVYDSTNGVDGYVSLEVAPDVAYNAQRTLEEARRLFTLVGKPNLMVKIPGTPQGIGAYEQAIAEGININVTLLFALGNFYQVADAYFRGLEARVAANQPINTISSVASFFVSRVDTTIDPRLQQLADAASDETEKQQIMALRGKAGIANAKVAYKAWQMLYASERWQALEKLGARKQRCLWASTSTKDPAYSDVMYVEQLIGPDTVDTIPPATITAFLDHGHAALMINKDVDEAIMLIGDIERRGISLEAVTYQLQLDGIKSFTDSFESMLAAISTKAVEVK
jgi:transaldolase